MGPLVVMADATIAPKSSFPMHPHQDIEVLSWVVSGTLRHKDDHGGTDELPAGTLQLMSARDGIVHAEGNLRDEPVRLLQFWLEPTSSGGEPVYSKVSWAGPGFQLLAAREGAALSLRQDAQVYAAKVTGAKATLTLPKNRRAYGAITWNGQSAADGAGVLLQPGDLTVEGTGQALVILLAP
jgi:quercetin 2,3-dioxygenase